MTIRQLCATDPQLATAVDALETRLYGERAAADAWSAATLAAGARDARRRLFGARQAAAAGDQLSPLNPA